MQYITQQPYLASLMAKPLLLTPVPHVVRTLFASAVELARAQTQIDLLPPGHISLETKARGGEYAKWRRYDVDGTPRAPEYLGERHSETARAGFEQLAFLKRLEEMAKQLRKFGFAVEDAASAVTVAALANAGFFSGGGVLVGTRAFNCLLNQQGFYAADNLGTQDIDIARNERIHLATKDASLLEILRGSGFRFLEIPGLDPREPASSWQYGKKDLKVDLLVPAKTKPYEIRKVPELRAHATALKHLDYLIKDVVDALLIGKYQLIPVRVPDPARFCWHKLATASLREGTQRSKKHKDIFQAACLAIMLASEDMDALVDAAQQMPAQMRAQVTNAFAQLDECLRQGGHTSLADELSQLLRRNAAKS